MKKYLQSPLGFVSAIFVTAILVYICIYPEIFLSFKTSFTSWNDICVEYPPVFALTSFFYQGGLQLWDFFAQMPYFHSYDTLGLFKFPNVVSAVTYYLLNPFTSDSARLFHHVFTWGYLFSILLVRLVGIFLLLRLVTRNRIILAVSTVIFSVFCCQIAAMDGAFYRNYMPLGAYFVIRLFQTLELRFLIASFLYMVVVMGNEPLHGSYMYLPIHFLIIAGVLWRFFIEKDLPAPQHLFWHNWKWRDAIWTFVVAFLILAPYAYIVQFGFPDFAFGQQDSRIGHPFSPQWYFHNPNVELGSPRLFFSKFLNMQVLGIEFYVGLSFIFLAMAGMVFNRTKLKWYFIIAIMLLWMLSFPREGLNIGILAHWINALTNPLKTIPRSYEATCQSMFTYLLMPLAVMGVEAIGALFKGQQYSNTSWRLLAIMLLALVINGLSLLPVEVNIYVTISAVLLLAAMGWVHWRNTPAARNGLVTLIGLLAVIDVLLIVHQGKNFIDVVERKPFIIDAAPQAGLVESDFVNPSIFPYRTSYLSNFSYRDEVYLWFPHGLSSDVHHVINQQLNFTWMNGMNPRHISFAGWIHNPVMLNYLNQNGEFMFMAKSVIRATPDGLNRIITAGMARQVVEVEDPEGILGLTDQWPANLSKTENDNIQYSQIVGVLDETEQSYYRLRGDLMVYSLRLPPSFPDHLASSWFMPEQKNLRFFAELTDGKWREMVGAQGELIRPYTFDVQNIKKGELKAAFPKDEFPFRKRCAFLYPSPNNPGVAQVWRKQFDNLGVIYRATKDGWFVAHYPYDRKWRILVDGNQVQYYRVNESFIGFPLTRGEHKILIQYWPHSPLRIMLLISALLTTCGLLLLIRKGIQWERIAS